MNKNTNPSWLVLVVALLAIVGVAIMGRPATTQAAVPILASWDTHNAFTQQDVTYFLAGLTPPQIASAKIVPMTNALAPVVGQHVATFVIWYQTITK